MRIAPLPSIALCLFILVGCTPMSNESCQQSGSITEPSPSDNGAADRQYVRVAEVLPVSSTAIDLLFVVDDSGSMADEQDQLGTWADELFGVLSLDGELPDLHVAVISSSLNIPGIIGCNYGGDGRFHTGDAELGDDHFLRDVAGADGRIRNYEGPLTETFAKMARVGDSGCGFEQPFEATRRALSGQLSVNDGFLRDDALLVVVFVSDEDDCSVSDVSLLTGESGVCSPLGQRTSFRCFEFGVRCADGLGMREFGPRQNCRPDDDSAYIEPVSTFARFLKGLKDHPGKVVVAGVYGTPQDVVIESDPRYGSSIPRLAKSCESSLGSATPGIRFNSFFSQFPARNAQSTICESNLAWAMRNTGLVTRRVATRSNCLAGQIAYTNERASGLQPSCYVEAITNAGTSVESTTNIPRCESSDNGRCYAIEADPIGCSETESQLAFRVREPATVAGETLIVSCEQAVGLLANQ